MYKPRVITVSQLNYYVKSLLENDSAVSNVFVTGEISNLTNHYSSGHIYFSLKDKNSVIKAVMFSFSARNLKFVPEEGMKVIARGRVSLYEPTGMYQLYVEDMQPDGIGALTIAFEQLKKKLESEGLFDAKHKKQIPQFPKTVAVITSPTGAAVQDIRNILFRRFPCVDVIMCPVLVQGSEAPQQLTRAINILNDNNVADVIIIGRGGGSIEDLWAFNDENLARAIYNCKIPVISAVGHETDFTICDFVSDLRAPTPSAAAELAVPDKEELKNYYNSQQQYLSAMLEGKISNLNLNLSNCKNKLISFNPENSLKNIDDKLKEFYTYFNEKIKAQIETKETSIKTLGGKLEALNPVSVLQRGYSFVEKDNKVINSVKELKIDDEIKLTLKDGTINAKVVGK